MRHLFVLILLVGCGKVTAGAGPDGGAGDGAGPAPGSFVWQRNLFGSFIDRVVMKGDQLYLGVSPFAALDLGNGIMVPAGGTDVMAVHYTTDGVLKSAWRHGGVSNENALGFDVDPFGNPAIGVLYDGAGTANVGGADLPPVPVIMGVNPNFEGAAASYTDAGMLRWQTPLTASTQLFMRSASTSSNGLTAVTGSFTGTLSVGGQPRATSMGGNDVFYVALGDTGSVAALQTFGGTGEDLGYRAIFDPLGTVILVGTFSGKVAFGSFGLDAGTGADLFVVRMSAQGTPMWAIQGGGTGDVGATLAATTPSGDVILAVAYQGSFQATGGDMVSSAGASDIALLRVSSAGTVMWTRSFGGAGADMPREVAVGRNGEIALTGEFQGQASFGGDTFTSVGGLDSFVAKYTADGAHVWSHAAGSAAVDRGLCVAVDASGAVYAGISFHGTIDFGGGPLSAPGTDFGAVLVKYSP
jgi:hypothetical protein